MGKEAVLNEDYTWLHEHRPAFPLQVKVISRKAENQNE